MTPLDLVWPVAGGIGLAATIISFDYFLRRKVLKKEAVVKTVPPVKVQQPEVPSMPLNEKEFAIQMEEPTVVVEQPTYVTDKPPAPAQKQTPDTPQGLAEEVNVLLDQRTDQLQALILKVVNNRQEIIKNLHEEKIAYERDAEARKKAYNDKVLLAKKTYEQLEQQEDKLTRLVQIFSKS